MMLLKSILTEIQNDRARNYKLLEANAVKKWSNTPLQAFKAKARRFNFTLFFLFGIGYWNKLNRIYELITFLHAKEFYSRISVFYYSACESESDITAKVRSLMLILHVETSWKQGSYASPDKSIRYSHRFYATDPGPTSVSELSAKLFQLSIPVNSGKLLKATFSVKQW